MSGEQNYDTIIIHTSNKDFLNQVIQVSKQFDPSDNIEHKMKCENCGHEVFSNEYPQDCNGCGERIWNVENI